MDDIFNDVVISEEIIHNEGFREGVDKGRCNAEEEGSSTGIKAGKQIGSEIGYYLGFVLTLQNILESDNDMTDRKKKTLDSLTHCIEQFPLDDPENVHLQDRLQIIRDKFKQLISQLKIGNDVYEKEKNNLGF